MTRASDLAKLLTGGRTLGGTGEVIVKDIDTADGSSPKITLQTGDTDIAADDVLGTIDFQAPDEGTGTDAILVAAGVEAKAEGDFSSSSNATSLVLKTGASEAAAEKVRITSAGKVGVGVTSPNAKLSVSGTGTVDLGIGSTNAGGAYLYLDGDSNGDFSGSDYSYIAHDTSGQLLIHQDSPSGSDNMIFRTNATEAMRIDANGHVTKPLQTAFLAEPSSNQTDLAINTANLQINFGNEVFDQNGDYNTSNSTFTAPVTGKYQLNLGIYFLNVNANYVYLYLQIKTSNRNYRTEIQPQVFDSDGGFSMSVSQICDMDASDTATVTCQLPNTGSNQTDVHTYSQFSGYLVA